MIVIATTNIPWELDPAVRRRLERRIYVPLPERRARLELLAIALQDLPNHQMGGQDLEDLADMTNGFVQISSCDGSITAFFVGCTVASVEQI